MIINLGLAYEALLSISGVENRQARVENAFFRYKSIIGDTVRARSPGGQAAEALLACNVLNQMTWEGHSPTASVGEAPLGWDRGGSVSIHAPTLSSAVVALVPLNRVTRHLGTGDPRTASHLSVDEPLYLAVVAKRNVE